MLEALKRHGAAILALLAISVAVYWVALGAFFVSDDFEFLTIVASAQSALVIFEPLVGRFVRPFVVLMYYVCYKLFGLVPWPYHVATLLPHLLSTILVYAVGLRLLTSRTGAFLAALLFAVFSGHSEAVAWPAGIADPIVAVFLLASFLCYLRACEPGAPAWWAVASALAVVGAILTKEVWVSYPAILLAHALLLGERTPQARRRAAVLVVVTGGMVVLYLVMRQAVFGSVTGGYAGLGTSFGTPEWFAQVRAFVIRSFLPAGNRATALWGGPDLLLWAAAAVLVAIRARGHDLRVVAFTAAAMMLALAPVLPLTISVMTTESERFTYVATIFSCLLIVSAASAILRRRGLVAAACGVLITWHAVVLVKTTIRWRDAGEMARGIIDSFAEGVRRYDPEGRRAIFLLNLPDNLRGAYVFRRGFGPAIHLFAPDVGASTERTFAIATNSFAQVSDATEARQTAAGRFAIDLTPGHIIQSQVAGATWFRVVAQSRTGYEVAFADTISNGLVFHVTRGRVHYTGVTAGPGLPFGSLDIPADGAVCAAEALRFSGWALDDTAIATVSVEAESAPGAFRPLGAATFATGTRPDVTAFFRWLPNRDRAEWNFLLPCSVVAGAPGRELRVRVTAFDSGGQRAELGARVVRAPQ